MSSALCSNDNKLSIFKTNKKMSAISRQRDRTNREQQIHLLYNLKTENAMKIINYTNYRQSLSLAEKKGYKLLTLKG